MAILPRWIVRSFRWSLEKVFSFPAERKRLWTIIKAFIVGIPAVLLGFAEWNFKDVVPLQSWVSQYFEKNPLWLFILLFLPIILTVLFELYEELAMVIKERTSLEAVQLITLLAALDEIVGHKMERFGAFLREIRNKRIAREEIFDRITQPDHQIDCLISQLHVTLHSLTNDHSLKIVLVSIENGLPADFVQFMPKDSRPHQNILEKGADKSLFHFVAKEKKPIWIEDIEAYIALPKPKVKKYYTDGDYETNKGSIVEFPILHPHLNKVVYVLTIKSEKIGFIGKTFAKKFKKVVEIFSKRIILEHSLKCIKERAQSWEAEALMTKS